MGRRPRTEAERAEDYRRRSASREDQRRMERLMAEQRERLRFWGISPDEPVTAIELLSREA